MFVKKQRGSNESIIRRFIKHESARHIDFLVFGIELIFDSEEMEHMIRSVKCLGLTHQKEAAGADSRHQQPRKATHSLEKTFCRNCGGGIVSPCVHTD